MPTLPQRLDIDVALTFLDFVAERHRIWEKRQAGEEGPWTEDPILATRKFTNVFRVLDHGSQFLFLDGFLEGDPRDVLMRSFLYRHTGRTEVWDYLLTMLGGPPTVADLDETLELFKAYRGKTKLKKITAERKPGAYAGGSSFRIPERPIFTGAYLVFPQSSVPGTDKIESIIDLTRRLFDPASPTDCVPSFLSAKTQADRFASLRSNKGIANFMSMQILTDWGYSEHAPGDLEDDFVIAGPGAERGTALVGLKPAEGIAWGIEAVRALEDCPRLPLPDGGFRRPSAMDIQNCFCEFQKYVRFSKEPVPKKSYRPAHPGEQPAPRTPTHWIGTDR